MRGENKARAEMGNILDVFTFEIFAAANSLNSVHQIQIFIWAEHPEDLGAQGIIQPGSIWMLPQILKMLQWPGCYTPSRPES